VVACERATAWLLDASREALLAVATPYLNLLGTVYAGALLAKGALAALELQSGAGAEPCHAMRIITARFYAESIMTAAGGLASTVTGSASVVGDAAALFDLHQASK